MKSNTSWKDSIQTFGRSLLLPIALLAPIGMVMGICSAMGQSYMIEKFPFLGNEILVLILLGLDSDTFYIYHVTAVMVDNLRRLLLGINLSDKAIMDFDFPGVGFPV